MEFIKDYILPLITLLGFFGIGLEISPIKLNPIKSIFSYLGNAFNKSNQIEFEKIKKDIAKGQEVADAYRKDSVCLKDLKKTHKEDMAGVEKLVEEIKKLNNKIDKMEMDSDFKDVENIKSKISAFEKILSNPKEKLMSTQYHVAYVLENRYQYYVDKYSHLPKGKRPNGELEDAFEIIKKAKLEGRIKYSIDKSDK